MTFSGIAGRCLAACCLIAAVSGCEEAKPQAAPAPSAAAVPPPATTPPAAATTSAAPPAAAGKGERPSKIDTELTPARRAAIEAKHAKAAGFLVASELEAKLKANKALKDKKTAVAAFDKAASGKWVLFTGPLVNLTDAGFDIGVVYTPQLPNDPMGMSRQFFEVTLTNVEGYAKDSFKDGNVVVVLAKYNGGGKASPGQELVASGDWN